MSNTRVRGWSQLQYYDPVRTLIAYRVVELQSLSEDFPPKVARLRTANLNPEREARYAALFSIGMSYRLGIPVVFSPVEAADHDFIVSFQAEGARHFTPVQLKELVSAELNTEATLEGLIKQLRARPIATDTVLAIRLNRAGREDLSPERFTDIPFREIWLFWAASPDATEWRLLGDMKSEPILTEYVYPVGA
jgi:hypothetical protein